MVVKSYLPFWKLGLDVLPRMLPVIIYVLGVCWLDLRYHLEESHFPIAIVAILGTVIGLLLAFRTNSSYDRWWEARTIWGAIVNDSRTLVRQLFEFSRDRTTDLPHDEALRRMAYRQIAWCYALSRSLREQDPTQDMNALIAEPELVQYHSSHNVPNSILLAQGKDLRMKYDANQLELFQFIELEKTLTRLTNSMGGCERIKNTVFPTSYTRLVNGLIYVFVLFLPFGLLEVPAIGLIATSLILSFGFLLINHVSIFLQDPFSNRPSDTPMLTLSRTIEINIRQMLDEDELPQPMQPIGGVLY